MIFTDEPVEPEEPTQVFDGPVSEDEARWVDAHYEELVKQYGGEWIAVANDAVIAHAKKLSDVRIVLDELNLGMVFIEQIPTWDRYNNVESGQSVYQLHLHLPGGRVLGWPPG